MISGNWTRIPLLLLVDQDLPEEHLSAILKAVSDPELNMTRLESVTLQIPGILESMRKDGYARRILLEYPYEISDTAVRLALYEAFKKLRVGIQLSAYPAQPYGLIDHTVRSPRDYLRIADEYMSLQDPLTLSRLLGIERPPPAAYLDCAMEAPGALLAFAKTIATGVVVATTQPECVPQLPFVMTPEFVDDAEEYVDAVLDIAGNVFQQLKAKNK